MKRKFLPGTLPPDAFVALVRLQEALDEFMQAATKCGYGDTQFWQDAAQASFTVHMMISRYAPAETESKPKSQ